MIMINSHCDDDHRYGLLRFVSEMRQRAALGQPVSWNLANFEFYTPFLLDRPDPDPNHIGSFQTIVNEMTAAGLEGEGIHGNMVGDLILDYPEQQWDAILRFRQGAQPFGDPRHYYDLASYDVPQGGRTRTNQSSILMRTGPLDQKPIYFTGDSSVAKIAPRMLGANPQPGGPNPPIHLAIYKIQHHGAHEDSMWDNRDLVVGWDVTYESVIYMLLNLRLLFAWPHYYDGIPKDNLPGTYDISVAFKLAEWAVHEVNTRLAIHNQTAQHLLDLLGARHNALIDAAFHNPAGRMLDYNAFPLARPWPLVPGNQNTAVDPKVVFDAVVPMTKGPNRDV